jgi:predicted enzyme related to lactoylglutathione lyase
MKKPRIRHLAIISREPEKLAKFYQDVFDMELIYSRGPGRSHFLTDGYLTIAILKHNLQGTARLGIDHFGFDVEDAQEFINRIIAAGVEEPKSRPDDFRNTTEYRAVDPEGNWFDLSVRPEGINPDEATR